MQSTRETARREPAVKGDVKHHRFLTKPRRERERGSDTSHAVLLRPQ
uniref:Uncharacterized protein n=1 Tax=Arundo donax TaxID=35708 RepID=A0A0A8XUG8_ARUDO